MRSQHIQERYRAETYRNDQQDQQKLQQQPHPSGAPGDVYVLPNHAPWFGLAVADHDLFVTQQHIFWGAGKTAAAGFLVGHKQLEYLQLLLNCLVADIEFDDLPITAMIVFKFFLQLRLLFLQLRHFFVVGPGFLLWRGFIADRQIFHFHLQFINILAKPYLLAVVLDNRHFTDSPEFAHELFDLFGIDSFVELNHFYGPLARQHYLFLDFFDNLPALSLPVEEKSNKNSARQHISARIYVLVL